MNTSLQTNPHYSSQFRMMLCTFLGHCRLFSLKQRFSALLVVVCAFSFLTNKAQAQGNGLAVTDFSFAANEVVSFTFSGNRTLGGQSHRMYVFDFENSNGDKYRPAYTYMTVPTSRTVDVANAKSTAIYQWGEVTVDWEQFSNKVNVVVSVKNNTLEPMIDVRHYVYFFGTLPAAITDLTLGKTNHTETIAIRPVMEIMRFTDGNGSLLMGLENAEEGTFALLQGSTTSSANPFVAFSRINPGETQTVTLTFRHSPYDLIDVKRAPEVAPDIFAQFGVEHPFDNIWEDRRSIGVIFNASTGYAPFVTGSTTNLRGWAENQLGGAIDVTSQAGVANLHTRLLSQLNNAISNAKNWDMQGLIVWDLEGQEGPHPVSAYVGDPETLSFSAPELLVNYAGTNAPFIDVYMQRILDANLRIGLTIRPTEVRLAPNWGGNYAAAPWRVRQYLTPDPLQELRSKILYAYNRWGVTIFYIDSFTTDSIGDPLVPQPGAEGGDVLPASILASLKAEFPDFLLIPENDITSHLGHGAPWQASSGEGSGLAHNEQWRRAIWPNVWAFSVNGRQTEVLPASANSVVTSIQRGDIQLANAWFTGTDQTSLATLYDMHGDPQLSLADLSDLVIIVDGVNPTGVLSFGRDSRSTPRNPSVDWSITEVPGRISDVSVNTGELVAPNDSQSITFDVDAAGLGVGSHDLGYIVIETQGHETWVNVQLNVVTPVPDPIDPRAVPGLEVWLDAQDASSFTFNGNRIQQWSDKSGNGHHALQLSSSAQPEIAIDAYSGVDLVQFFHSGVINWLAIPHAASLNFSQATIFCVFQPTASQVWAGILRKGQYNINAQYALHASLDYLLPSSGNIFANINPPPASIANISVMIWDSNGVHLNGVFISNRGATGFPTTVTSPSNLEIGRGWFGHPFKGYIGEILIYDRILTASERAAIEDWLYAKWSN